MVPGRTSGAWNDAARAYYTRETVRCFAGFHRTVCSYEQTPPRVDFVLVDIVGVFSPRLGVFKRALSAWELGDEAFWTLTAHARARWCNFRSTQVNLSSAYGASVRVPIPAIDLRSLALAWRQESSWQQKALSVVSSALLPSVAQQGGQSIQARLRHLDEQFLTGESCERGASKPAAYEEVSF